MEFVARAEGGWSTDPADPGGETRYGISSAANPEVDLAALTPAGARAIYRRDYWNHKRLSCDRLARVGGTALAVAVFDAAVHSGVRRAAIWLQAAAEDLTGPLTLDGRVGPITLARVARCDPGRLIALITARRLTYLVALGNRHPRFDDGWILRIARLLDYLAALEISPRVSLGRGGDK